jgi:hypothetical protein
MIISGALKNGISVYPTYCISTYREYSRTTYRDYGKSPCLLHYIKCKRISVQMYSEAIHLIWKQLS